MNGRNRRFVSNGGAFESVRLCVCVVSSGAKPPKRRFGCSQRDTTTLAASCRLARRRQADTLPGVRPNRYSPRGARKYCLGARRRPGRGVSSVRPTREVGALRALPLLRSRSGGAIWLSADRIFSTKTRLAGLHGSPLDPLDSCRMFSSPGPSFLAANSPWRRFTAGAGL